MVAGFITGKLMNGSGFGWWMNIIIGTIGAVIEGLIYVRVWFRRDGGLLSTMLLAVCGAVILTCGRLFTGDKGSV